MSGLTAVINIEYLSGYENAELKGLRMSAALFCNGGTEDNTWLTTGKFSPPSAKIPSASSAAAVQPRFDGWQVYRRRQEHNFAAGTSASASVEGHPLGH